MLEIHQVPRITDYTQQKISEDNKGILDQTNIVVNSEKEIQRNSERVRDTSESNYHNEKFDAKEEGKNKYYSNREDSKKKKDGDRVIVKKAANFDMRV